AQCLGTAQRRDLSGRDRHAAVGGPDSIVGLAHQSPSPATARRCATSRRRKAEIPTLIFGRSCDRCDALKPAAIESCSDGVGRLLKYLVGSGIESSNRAPIARDGPFVVEISEAMIGERS